MKTGKLLIVDDEPDILETLQEILADRVDSIDLADDGTTALKLIAVNKYDAILSDIRMAEMSGIDLLASIRKKGIQTPFIVLTAHGDKKLAVDALRLGAFEFVDKPFHLEELKNTITRAIELGKELNFWSLNPDMMSSLDSMSKENGAKSLAILHRALGMLAKENAELRLKKTNEED